MENKKIEKVIKTEKKNLNELDLKPVELKAEDGQDYFDFLSDYLQEELNLILKENKIKPEDTPNLRYSLSHSQGDGLSFTGSFKWKHYNITIKEGHLSNLYCHSNTVDIYIETEKGNEPRNPEDTETEFKNIYNNICKKLEKFGYGIIEETEKENILKAGFERWKEENEINADIELFDLNYKTNLNTEKHIRPAEAEKKTAGYIKIADEGNTYLNLWIPEDAFKIVIKDIMKAEIKNFKIKEVI